MKYFDKYERQLSLELYEKIKDKKIVYLDTKYWILLRDEKKTTDKIKREVIALLIHLFNSNKCIFPISETIYWEVMKQAEETRKSTFEIIDKFSLGLTITNNRARVRAEFYYWWQSLQQIENLIEPKKLIWTNIHLEVGGKYYSKQVEQLDEKLQKQYFDFVCKFSINNFFNLAGTQIPPVKYKDNIDAFNESKEQYKNENKTFDEMFLSELGGMLDVFRDEFSTVIDICKAEKLNRVLSDNEKHTTDAQQFCNIIYHSFRLKKINTELPFLKIYPSLFGLMRWNKERRYKDGNDTMDVMHASTALPYCDYFFTERELHSMVSQLKLDKSFNCIVESSPEKILHRLTML